MLPDSDLAVTFVNFLIRKESNHVDAGSVLLSHWRFQSKTAAVLQQCHLVAFVKKNNFISFLLYSLP